MKRIRFLIPRLEYMLFAALFWSICASGPKILNVDGDLPRHLLVGRLIRETRSVPLTDTFSFRTVGFPSFPHEWLSQVLLSLANDLLGLSGVVILTALIVTLTWAIVFGEASRRSNNLFITIIVTALGMSVSMIHVLPRPHIFTYLFTALWIVILERINGNKPRLWWLMPVVMLLWVNMHGMFILGIAIWGTYLLGSLLEHPSKIWFTQPTTRWIFIGGISSFIATFLSPSGIKIWGAIASLGSNAYITSHIAEYQSANFHLPETWPFILLLIIIIMGFGRSTNKITWRHILLVTAFAAIALYTSRMIPLFAIVAVPITAGSLSDWINSQFPDSRFRVIENNIANINAASSGVIWLLLLFFAVVLIFQSGRLIDAQGKGNTFDETFFPVQAVTWLNSHPQQGHMFNEFDWGGYLLLKLSPRQQIFMDGHTHIYGETLTREYETVITLGNDWQEILDKYQVQWAIVRTNSAIANALANNQWKIIYQDDTSVILHKP
jgi:hypothetical protein